ncbi:DNA-3-methyladenine glycosylase [Nocardioides currus]|uniref:Putative 3-methyladenine DNA glycosylase n=1 Tax=Nocardioides currus TaxID=2133958 RepID=A0A2R7YUJ1_9ACTN|nr:DNA-3-methyladenine glycosylase [Nocardioides currus]PUA79559.1 DNA-3-methyladenine glycosylase [Nocardioides currus]
MSASADLAAHLAGPVLEVAPTLLGSTLRCDGVAVRITEVEAYAGADDPGSHSYRGPTARNAAMFGPPGHLYVYFTYGMHHCANVVCGPEGTASGVLLRAGEVVEGVATARARRPGASDRDLARGPARLCTALAIDLADYGCDLSTGRVTLELADPPDPETISRGPRVGLRHAAEAPWRFWLSDERSVSVYRPAARRARRQASDLHKQ